MANSSIIHIFLAIYMLTIAMGATIPKDVFTSDTTRWEGEIPRLVCPLLFG